MTTSLKIIGLTGPAGCGKDTVGALLQQHAGFEPIAFADALRSEVATAFNIDMRLLTDRAGKELPTPQLSLHRCLDMEFTAAMITLHHGKLHTPFLDMEMPRSPRQVMQWWGTDYRRQNRQGYWVSKTLQKINFKHRSGTAHAFALTDVRFPNEAQLVRELGGQLWQIHREGLSVAPGAHASETTGAAFSPNAVIDNSGTMAELREQVLGEHWRQQAGLKRVSVEIEA